MKISKDYTMLSFQRKPSSAQMKEYSGSIKEGLQVLNKEVGIILHNTSAPSRAIDNTGIGSLLSTASITKLRPFLQENGITSIMQEPLGIRKPPEYSPYSPLSDAKSAFLMPLEKLTTPKYGEILSLATLKSIVKYNPSVKEDKVTYPYVTDAYQTALKEAYTNFKLGMGTLFLANEFENYKSKNYEMLEASAIYEILASKYKDDDWRTWKEADKYLFDPKNAEQKLITDSRLQEIRTNHASDIDFFMFKQMLIEKEITEANTKYNESGIKLMGDSPIAFTPTDEWLNKDLFLKDFALGCPPDYFSADGQRWDFAVLDPEKIFNPDGTIGPAGELLKRRYEDMFKEASGGIRIDHLIGLIDPYVYSTTSPKMTPENSGRLYSSPYHPLLGRYAKNSDEEYSAILTKIVIPAAEKFGLSKEEIICEDLGTITEPVKRVMDKLKLSGIFISTFDQRARDGAHNKVIMLGSHDNPSLIEHVDGVFNGLTTDDKRCHFGYKTWILAEDTVPCNKGTYEHAEEIRHDKLKYMAASFVELFTSPAKKIQIFFTDVFGIGKTYNKPGTKEGCWELRLPENFEDLYYQNLTKGLGINFPESIANAIRHRGEWFANEHKILLEKLDKFTQILKEK